jgi:hypothetical protein
MNETDAHNSSYDLLSDIESKLDLLHAIYQFGEGTIEEDGPFFTMCEFALISSRSPQVELAKNIKELFSKLSKIEGVTFCRFFIERDKEHPEVFSICTKLTRRIN